jgi:hypothetical protein
MSRVGTRDKNPREIRKPQMIVMMGPSATATGKIAKYLNFRKN